MEAYITPPHWNYQENFLPYISCYLNLKWWKKRVNNKKNWASMPAVRFRVQEAAFSPMALLFFN